MKNGMLNGTETRRMEADEAWLILAVFCRREPAVPTREGPKRET
jgi:hypothetical protein